MAARPTNSLYDLTTEHGRAQSHAHSAHGAFLVEIVEESMLNQLEKLQSTIEQSSDKVLEDLNTGVVNGQELLEQFTTFHKELGVRDKAAFQPIFEAFKENHIAVLVDMQRLIKLVKQIRVVLEIDDAEQQKAA